LLLQNSNMPKIPFWIFILIAILYFTASRVDIMDIDAAQYAEISREMAQTGDYLHIYDRGYDYLDKPPFLFWVSAISMNVFGVNNFGYRFPSIIFALLAIYATYRLTKLLYNEATARMAALILATCQGMFLMTNDVRTDTILMSWVITAIWMIKECDIKRRWYYVLGGCASIAFGMMTKGPIALLVPMFCFGSDWALKREWKKIFAPHHLIDILIIAVFLIPMSIGLYQQFDMHPEKVMDGRSGVSGLRFFFWSQSFGRITGESPWDNGAGFDFLFSNMLWSFLPWIFLFIPALVINIAKLLGQKLRLAPQQEWISTGGFILTYIALGSSHYQLPHYIFVAFPLVAIITANFLAELFEGKYRTLYKIIAPFQITISALLLIAIFLIMQFTFPAPVLWYVLLAIAFITWLFILLSKQFSPKIFWTNAAAIILCNFFFTNYFYHNLLQYQVGSQVGKFIYKNKIPADQVVYYRIHDPLDALHFYSRHVISDDSSIIINGKYVLTDIPGMSALSQTGYSFDTLKTGVFFKVSELTPDFLNNKTRYKTLQNYYFVKLK
jgi:4-amino-4-deoxy-L-arabinose transferase-like glycosyltransferase